MRVRVPPPLLLDNTVLQEVFSPVGDFIQELIQTGVYKRNQGRITRQLTFAALAVTVALGLWRLSDTLIKFGDELRFGLPAVLLLAGLWVAYRIVNVPAFADFLIAVEAEMNKVSWPTRTELFRASIVVLVTLFVLAALLFVFDVFWQELFTFLGILRRKRKKEGVQAAAAVFGLDWIVLLILLLRVF